MAQQKDPESSSGRRVMGFMSLLSDRYSFLFLGRVVFPAHRHCEKASSADEAISFV
ncbi:hypothetical protein G6M26_23050 [Agrobacterium tumefaciens]|nr:hypothetical protein [Agrobacterium tumefaciens]NTE21420.1 hypothetical protein [Agrobacterium tumefaciens]